MNVSVGTFEVKSGKIVVSDPCYGTDTWCMDIIPAKNGRWQARVDIRDEGDADDKDDRVASLTAIQMDTKDVGSWKELEGEFGVDSGQFSFVDAKAYQNQTRVPKKTKWKHTKGWKGHDKWYKMVCEHTLERQYGIIPGGVVSSSGYGDGVYQVFVKYVGRGKTKFAAGLKVIFID
jgi:hypothetical protein